MPSAAGRLVGETRRRPRAGSAAFDLAVVHVWTVRDTWIEVYIDAPAMREALGSA